MIRPMVLIAGRLVSAWEYELLGCLGEGSAEMQRLGDTARSIGINVGPNGWSVLRGLDSLRMRGLVESYVHESGELAWRLTERAAEGLGALA